MDSVMPLIWHLLKARQRTSPEAFLEAHAVLLLTRLSDGKLAVSGDTFKVKDDLKALGGRWNSGEIQWEFQDQDDKLSKFLDTNLEHLPKTVILDLDDLPKKRKAVKNPRIKNDSPNKKMRAETDVTTTPEGKTLKEPTTPTRATPSSSSSYATPSRATSSSSGPTISPSNNSFTVVQFANDGVAIRGRTYPIKETLKSYQAKWYPAEKEWRIEVANVFLNFLGISETDLPKSFTPDVFNRKGEH